MSKFFRILESNVCAISPKSKALLGDNGWCSSLSYHQQQSAWANESLEFKERLQGLGRDLTRNPLTINNKTYYSFAEMKQDFDELKSQKNLSTSQQDFVDGMNDVLAFIDANTIYLSPKKITFMRHAQDVKKSFLFAAPLMLEKLSKDMNPQPLPIYRQPIKLSKKNPQDLMELINEIDKLPNSKLMSFALDSLVHSIAIINVDNKWQIFNQNTLFADSFYQELNIKNLVNAFNFTRTPSDIAFCNLTVYASPLTTTQADAIAIKQKLETTSWHKKLTSEFIKARDERAPELKDFYSPIQIANQEGHLEAVKKLITPDIKNSKMAASLLIHAIVYGHIDLVKFYIDQKFPLKRNNSEKSFLTYAAEYGHHNIVKMLLDSGEDVNYPTSGKNIALHAAAKNGHLDIVKTLIQAKSQIDFKNEKGKTPVSLAISNGYYEISEFLIKQAVNLNQVDEAHNTLLHSAAKGGNFKILSLLLSEEKINPNQKNSHGFKPIHYAIQDGNFELFKLLLANGTTLNNKKDHYLLTLAAKSGNLDIVDYLIKTQKFDVNAKNKQGKTALHLAVEYGHREVVKYLLKERVNVDAEDKEKVTPLQLAAVKGHTTMAQLLITHGANITSTNKYNHSALTLAISKGFTDIVSFLINKGANINERGMNTDNTPLHLAAYSNYPEIAQLLLNNGADVNAINKNNETPLQYAASQGFDDMALLLASKGGSINLSSENDKEKLYAKINHKDTHPYMIKILLKTLAPQNTLSKDVVLELALIAVNKTQWKTSHIYYKQPETVRIINQIIETARQQAQQQPDKSIPVWNKAFDDVIHQLTVSVNKASHFLGTSTRDPSTHENYKSLLTLLTPYATPTLAEKSRPSP